jgi:N-acetylneuraminic acid mutarotase
MLAQHHGSFAPRGLLLVRAVFKAHQSMEVGGMKTPGYCKGTWFATVLTGVLFVLAALGAAEAQAVGWTDTNSLATPRRLHTETLLPDGRVLVAGGFNGSYLASAEIYDRATNMWSTTGNLVTARRSHTATLLPDGRVLVAGGYNIGFPASAEFYDPATGTWSATGALNTARYGHTATLLPDGRVLVVGGRNGDGLLDSAEFYDPTTGTWSATGALSTGREGHTATLLPDGRVLVVGGVRGVALASAELYDAATGTWSATGRLNTARCYHTATLLPDSRVLVAGGYNYGDDYLAGSELYDAATGTWSATGRLNTARSYHTATLLADGKVLAAGGWNGGYLAGSELYDAATGTWSATGRLNTARCYHTATLLPDSRVLVAGGRNEGGFLASAELYYPVYDGNGDGIPDWQQGNVFTFATFTDEGTCHLTLALPLGQTFAVVQACRDVPPLPAHVSLPYGYFTFTVAGLIAGTCTTVTVYLPGTPPVTYYKYGPTPDNPTPHWYDFSYDGETGAEIEGNAIILHLCDGKRGDQDLTENGTIVDPGGPAAVAVRPVLYFPYLVSGSGTERELGIINKENYEVSGTIEYFRARGTAAGSRSITLPARGKQEVVSSDFPLYAVSAVVSADGQLAGYGRCVTDTGQRFGIPGISRLGQSITIPFTTSSSYWRSGIAVMNPGAEEVTVAVEDVSQGPLSMTVGPKEQQFFWVSRNPDRISSSGGIVAVEVIESVRTGGDLGAVALGETNVNELYVPSLLFNSGSFSGAGVRNCGALEGTMTVWGYDGGGNAEEISLGVVSGRSQVGATLTGVLSSDTLWAKISGESTVSTPFGTPALSLQGLAVYGEDNSQAVGAIHLNALKFRRGIVGVMDEAQPPMVTVLNPGANAVQLTVTTYDPAGEVLEESQRTIGAGEVLEMTFLISGAGYVELDSDVDLYGCEIIRQDGKMEMLPVLQ